MEDGYKGGGWVKFGDLRDNNSRSKIVVVGVVIFLGVIFNRMCYG